MTFIWCEWICSHCGNIHRARYELVIGLEAAYQLKGRLYEKNGVYIEDVAFSLKQKPSKKPRSKVKSQIHVQWDTQLDKIFAALRQYMPQYYAIKEDTLKVEICRN